MSDSSLDKPAHSAKNNTATFVQSADGSGELVHSDELLRSFSFTSALGIAFANLNSWTAMAASLSLVLPSGGPVAMVWGLCVSTLGSLAMALSLAEVTHVYPTTGGQYDWTYALAPVEYRKGLAYFVGWMSTAGWISLVATGSSLGANFITGIISLWSDTFEAQPYQTFLLYLSFTIGACLLNTFAVRLLPIVDRAGFVWSLTGIVVVIITLLACQSGSYEPRSFVFGQWINETGWPDGVCFILGLLQSTFGLTGFDGIAHLVEEMPAPAMNAPKVMILAVLLGSVSSWIFVIVILFALTDIDTVISSATGPLLQIYYQATSNRAGATVLIMFNLGAMAFATQGLLTVASRVTMSFARDRGFGAASRFLTPVSETLRVPVWSVLFVSVWTVIFGLIYLGSSVALNAILSASVVFVQISYIVPISLVLFRGKAALEPAGFPPRRLTLGRWRVPINIAALVFAITTSIFFVFPPGIPVTGSSMSYVVVVLGFVWLLMGINWFVDGRKHYWGPASLAARVQQSYAAEKGHKVEVDF